jgi:Cu/Ag efflux pump CusA
MTFLLRGHVSEKESFVMRYARRRYRPPSAKVTGKGRPTLVAAITLVVVSGAIFPSIRLFYLPSGD